MGQNESHEASAMVPGVQVNEPIQGELTAYVTNSQRLLSEWDNTRLLKKKKGWKKTRFREVKNPTVLKYWDT